MRFNAVSLVRVREGRIPIRTGGGPIISITVRVQGGKELPIKGRVAQRLVQLQDHKTLGPKSQLPKVQDLTSSLNITPGAITNTCTRLTTAKFTISGPTSNCFITRAGPVPRPPHPTRPPIRTHPLAQGTRTTQDTTTTTNSKGFRGHPFGVCKSTVRGAIRQS